MKIKLKKYLVEYIALDNFIIWLIIGAIPVSMAIIPWDFNRRLDPFSSFLHSLSFPVIILELLVILIVAGKDFNILFILNTLGLWQKIVLFTLAMISIITAFGVASNSSVAVWRTAFWFVHLFFGFAVSKLITGKDRQYIRNIWQIIIFGVLAYILLLIVFIVNLENSSSFSWPFRLPGMGNVRSLGFFVLVGACATIGLAVFESNRIKLATWLSISSIIMALGAWSGSRGAFVAIISAGLISALISPTFRTIKVFNIYLISIVFGLLLSTVHHVPHKSFGITNLSKPMVNSSLDKYSSRRITIWEDSIEAIKSRPFFGYGESKFRNTVHPSFNKFNQPHNSILQFALQWGVIGTICFFSLSLYCCLRLLKQFQMKPSEMAPGFLIVIGMLVFSLYDAALFCPYPIMMIAMSLGIAIPYNSPSYKQ